VNEYDSLAEQFEENRSHLRAVAYRMLGSLSEADDAVQETWFRLRRSDISVVENLPGLMTTMVARECLDMLRSRTSRREEQFGVRVPDPIVSRPDGSDPEYEALLADSVGLALLVVLDTLNPVERVAFVLHDTFSVPFDDIAPIIGRTPTATRQIASRARRRVQGTATAPDTDITRQREVVDAFFAASRGGNFEALLAVLHPDVVLRADFGAVPESQVVRGARAVTERALSFRQYAGFAQPALINGAPGFVAAPGGQPFSVMAFTVRGGKIVEIDVLADIERLRQIDLSAFMEAGPNNRSP
jgi:RNA polymerase sigma factor (sigma-70 family)